MSFTTTELLNQLSSNTFSALSGIVLRDHNSVSHPKFLKETIVEYSPDTCHDETYRVYDLNYASIDDLIWLIESCDFSVYKRTLDELAKKDPNYDPSANEALGIYQLVDEQGANFGEIESDVFSQYKPTEEDLKQTLLAMIDRMEIYWEDHMIRFDEENLLPEAKTSNESIPSKLDQAFKQLSELVYRKMEERDHLDNLLRDVNTKLDLLENDKEAAAHCPLQDYFALQTEQKRLITQYKSITSELVGIKQAVNIVMTVKEQGI